MANLVVTPEEHAGVVFCEIIEPRIRGASRVPSETVVRVKSGRPQAGEESLEGEFPLDCEVGDLAVLQQLQDLTGADEDREDRLAQGAGRGDFEEAPFRGQQVVTAQGDDRAR